jgi:hypothetical protein
LYDPRRRQFLASWKPKRKTRLRLRHLSVLLFVTAVADAASAACVNKYIAQRDGSRYILTVLTGKLSYPEAYSLAVKVNNHTVPPPAWVDEKGKTIAKHIGEFKIIRPMPVACDERTSGVVLSTNFLSTRAPAGRIYIKFDDTTTIALEQQEK